MSRATLLKKLNAVRLQKPRKQRSDAGDSALTRDEATKNIPIIVCTSKGQETDKIWGLRQGAHDYMTKPINGDELLMKIAAL